MSSESLTYLFLKDLLIDLIFYSALFLSYSQKNPEPPLKKRLKEQPLKLFYEG